MAHSNGAIENKQNARPMCLETRAICLTAAPTKQKGPPMSSPDPIVFSPMPATPMGGMPRRTRKSARSASGAVAVKPAVDTGRGCQRGRPKRSTWAMYCQPVRVGPPCRRHPFLQACRNRSMSDHGDRMCGLPQCRPRSWAQRPRGNTASDRHASSPAQWKHDQRALFAAQKDAQWRAPRPKPKAKDHMFSTSRQILLAGRAIASLQRNHRHEYQLPREARTKLFDRVRSRAKAAVR